MPVHEISYSQKPPINAQVSKSSGLEDLHFGPSLNQHLYFMHASSEGSGEPRISADSPELSFLNNAMSNKISYHNMLAHISL